MVISKEKKCKININDNALKQLVKFNYLGSLIISDVRTDSEMNK